MYTLLFDNHITFSPPMGGLSTGVVLTRKVEIPFPPFEGLRLHSRTFDDCPVPEGFTLKDVVWDNDRGVFVAKTSLGCEVYPIREIVGVIRDWVSRGWALGCYRDGYGTRMVRVIPIHVLKEYMGHAKITTTQEYYLAAETQDADRARAALDAMTAEEKRTPQSGRMSDACGPKPASDTDSGLPPKERKPRKNRGLRKRGGRDSNPQPPDRQSGTLTN